MTIDYVALSKSNLIDLIYSDLGEGYPSPSTATLIAIAAFEEDVRKDERQKILKDNWMRYGGE